MSLPFSSPTYGTWGALVTGSLGRRRMSSARGELAIDRRAFRAAALEHALMVDRP
jgi:hypothetical protein